MLVVLLIAGILIFGTVFFLLFKTAKKRFESPYLAAGLPAFLAVTGFVLFSVWVLGNRRPWNADRACLEMLRSWCVEARCPDDVQVCADECDRLAGEALEKMPDAADCSRPAGLFE